MKRFALALMAGVWATQVTAGSVGLQLNQVEMPHHDKTAEVAIWYPGAGGKETTFAENPVFNGVQVAIGAEMVPGDYPVVLFSHGMGGTHRAQAWLARALAEKGAIVVAVNHPNTTWRDLDMAEGVKHWTRAQDMSVALDALMADPAFAGQIDTDRIMASGFSFGGWTALALGGMTANHAGIVETCAAHIDDMVACDILMSERVNMPGQDPAIWNASYADPRVRQVVAIDPGLVWGLQGDNTKDLVADATLIALGGSGVQMSATDFDASGLSDLLDAAEAVRIDPAFHFSVMPICKPAGAAILASENDDPVCTDPDGTNRAEVHQQVIDLIAKKLGV
ncbi:MAG: hypothetical protein AAF754_14970 [Pseudomonadota bacterium]